MSRSGQNTTTSYLEWNEFTSLIHRLERDGEFKFALLIALGTFTGLRISDLLTLRYSDFGNGDILKLKEKKTGKERSIKINKDLREIIERIKNKFAIEDTSQLIFLNKYGKKAIDKSYVNTKLKTIFKNYRVKAGGNVSTHTFRKTLGRRVMEVNNYSGESLILLMDLFGHSSPSITKKYLGIRAEEIHSVYDSLSI